MTLVLTHSPSRRLSGLAAVVLVHSIVIYGLATGLGKQIVDVVRAPLETKLVDDIKPKDQPPPPPPKLAPPPTAFVPLPDFKVAAPPPPSAITVVSTVKPPETVVIQRVPEPVVAAEPVRTPPQVTRSSCKTPDYPAASRRLEETGVVQLAFLVDVDGKAIESKIEQSSGFSRLDNAALLALQLCSFQPGTMDGKAVQAWAKIKYTWKLD